MERDKIYKLWLCKQVFQFNNSVKVGLSEEEAKVTPKALGIMYETMLTFLPKIQNIKKEWHALGDKAVSTVLNA